MVRSPHVGQNLVFWMSEVYLKKKKNKTPPFLSPVSFSKKANYQRNSFYNNSLIHLKKQSVTYPGWLALIQSRENTNCAFSVQKHYYFSRVAIGN